MVIYIRFLFKNYNYFYTLPLLAGVNFIAKKNYFPKVIFSKDKSNKNSRNSIIKIMVLIILRKLVENYLNNIDNLIKRLRLLTCTD